MRVALRKTVEPLYEIVQQDIYSAPARVDIVLKSTYIEQALRWLYVDWAAKQVIWFNRNFELERKNDEWLRRLSEIFGTVGAEKVTEILGTTKTLAKKTIQKALQLANEGKSIDVIQKAIKADIESSGGALSMGRARTIARTEVVGASSMATHEAVAASGANVEHRWITGGSNIRETHLAAEAQGWIPFNEPFRVGDYLMMHPHDPSGGAEEVINCKCAEIFRVVD